tara:strand:- start:122 stop:1198 length:1077 start_codon:yes stop_codon:yes gene_type:complete
MFKIFRPLIFKINPEAAHSLAIQALKTDIFFHKKNTYNEMVGTPILNTKFFGKNIQNPIGIAAGFDKDAEVYNQLFRLGFSFVEVGTITPKAQYGNPKPRVFRLEEDNALINRLGFNNSGSDKISSRIKKNIPDPGLLGINIGPNKDTDNRIEDYLKCFRKFYDYENQEFLGDYITINISSPNTENLRDFHNKNELEELLDAIQKEKNKLKSNIPIAVKISPDIENNEVDILSEILIKYSIDIAIISNTTDRNRESLNNINKLEKGGLSGKPIEMRSNELIKNFYKAIGKNIKIIGVGGVDSGKSALEKILNGASLVQLYTGMVYKGPNIAQEIIKELNDLLKNQGIKNISEIIGTKN